MRTAHPVRISIYKLTVAFEVQPMSASDAVDGSRRRHLGAIEWLLLKPTLKGGAVL